MPLTPQGRSALREALAVFGLSLALCLAFIGLGKLVPFVERNLHAFVALIFLLLPAWALGRRGEHLEDHGLNGRGIGRALAFAAVAAAVTFPPYVLGHHLYQSWFFDRPGSFSWSNYSAFPEVCQSPPRSDVSLAIWCERERLWLRWRGPLTVEIGGRGVQPAVGTGRPQARRGEAPRWRYDGANREIAVRVAPGGEARIDAHRGSTRLPSSEVAIGSRHSSEDLPFALGRGWFWLLELILAQLIAVALPEEVFYRGYLQGLLGTVFRRRRRILGVEVSVGAIVATSTLFALGHFLLDLNPLRLGVFFPSLLFGWIRCATPTLGGAIVFHAMCNVLVRLLIVHY